MPPLVRGHEAGANLEERELEAVNFHFITIELEQSRKHELNGRNLEEHARMILFINVTSSMLAPRCGVQSVTSQKLSNSSSA